MYYAALCCDESASSGRASVNSSVAPASLLVLRDKVTPRGIGTLSPSVGHNSRCLV